MAEQNDMEDIWLQTLNISLLISDFSIIVLAEIWDDCGEIQVRRAGQQQLLAAANKCI